VLRLSNPRRLSRKTSGIEKLEKSGHVEILYLGGMSFGRCPVASFGHPSVGCNGGKQKKQNKARKETHESSKTGWRSNGKETRKAEHELGENRWAVST
jgi:hypothetical protein